MFVTKEKAKELIDKAPGKIWIDSFDNITFVHTVPRTIGVRESCQMISMADIVDYQDNDFFGLLSLQGVKPVTTHNIRFSQTRTFVPKVVDTEQ